MVKQKVHGGVETQVFKAESPSEIDMLLWSLPQVRTVPATEVIRDTFRVKDGTQFSVVEWPDKKTTIASMFSGRYQLVPHEDVVGAIANEAKEQGFEIHATARLWLDGLRMAVNVSIPKLMTDAGGFEQFTPSVVGFNSIDGTLPVEYLGGAEIFVCQNGNLWGEVHEELHRKHTIGQLGDVQQALGMMAHRIIGGVIERTPLFAACIEAAAKLAVPKPEIYLKEHGIGPRSITKIVERMALHENPDVTPNTVWGIVNGITRYARDLENGNWAEGDEATGAPAVARARSYRQIADQIMMTVKS